MDFNVHYKERLYFGIMAVLSLLFYMGVIVVTLKLKGCGVHTLISILSYGLVFMLFKWFLCVISIGHVKGNGVKVGKDQFPELYETLENYSLVLGLKKIPDMYVLQGNGVLNAFATRFARKNFVVIYSDIFEMAYQEEKDAVSFIIGHELGHLKRRHVSNWRLFLTLPARFIPLLYKAYSRACEYTCDNFGYQLSAQRGISGLLILASGKKLYKLINVADLVNTANSSDFSFWFSELFSTHPHITKRLAALKHAEKSNQDINRCIF